MLGIFLALLLNPLEVCDSTFQYMDFKNPEFYETQYQTCISIARYAVAFDLDPYIAVSTGIQESYLIPTRVSPANARGPLQVTHYWCHQSIQDCNLTLSGVRALKLLRTCKYIDWEDYSCKRRKREPEDWTEALCHYNAGNNCTPSSYEYADSIITRAEKIRKISKRI